MKHNKHKQAPPTASAPVREHKMMNKEDSLRALKRLFSYLTGKYRALFVVVVICILLASVATVASSLFLMVLIDDYIEPLLLTANPVFDELLRLIILMAVIFVISIVASLAYNLIMVTISQGVLKAIRDDMFAHMQWLPVKYFDTHQQGDIMSHYTNDTDTLRQLLAQTIPQLLHSVTTIICSLTAMLLTSIWLTLVVLLGVVVMMKIATYVASRSGTYFVRQQYALARVNGYIEEMVHGQKVVKIFCHEEQTKRDFDVLNETLRHNSTEANKYANILMPLMGNTGHAIYVLLAIAGGALALAGVGGMTLGVIAAFLQLSRSFTNPISQVAQQANAVVMALAGAQRIFKLMDEAQEADEGDVTLVNVCCDEQGAMSECEQRTGHWAWKLPSADGFDYVPVRGDVRLKGVNFAYVEGKPVLHDVDVYAEPGQKVAFVGATGAGKTTITNLINRFYDVEEGVITYDGIEVKRIKKDHLRRALGIVLQDVFLFSGTVMENIRYGRLDATDEECIAAAKLANAHDFISRLPQGYDTMLSGESSGLSQGQRQLISIARVAVSDPPVMIMDEATSSIDTRTEKLVQDGMDSLMEGRTVFVIAHRLSTVKNSDVIMVLENGCIIERGDHNKLIAEQGKYYQLYTGAFELE